MTGEPDCDRVRLAELVAALSLASRADLPISEIIEVADTVLVRPDPTSIEA
jgi:hypothetical protein